jgi:hypothetical protein
MGTGVRGLMRPEREDDHSLPSSTEVKNGGVFDVLTAVVMKSFVFWDMASYSPRFGGICRLHLEVRRISQGRKQREADKKPSL